MYPSYFLYYWPGLGMRFAVEPCVGLGFFLCGSGCGSTLLLAYNIIINLWKMLTIVYWRNTFMAVILYAIALKLSRQ